jgi:DNA-binding XRE family transcriptional regulator
MEYQCGLYTVALSPWREGRGLQIVKSQHLPAGGAGMSVEAKLDDIREKLSDNIKRIRRERGLAQERLGLEAGVDRTVVSKIERKLANPSLEVLIRLANTLDVPVSDLLA